MLTLKVAQYSDLHNVLVMEFSRWHWKSNWNLAISVPHSVPGTVLNSELSVMDVNSRSREHGPKLAFTLWKYTKVKQFTLKFCKFNQSFWSLGSTICRKLNKFIGYENMHSSFPRTSTESCIPSQFQSNHPIANFIWITIYVQNHRTILLTAVWVSGS